MPDPGTNFGTDTSCVTAIRTGRLASRLQLIAEAAYRRLTTPRGMLYGGEDEANYGLDLVGLIGTVVNKSQAAALPAQIQAELQKDERIQSVTATVSQSAQGAELTWSIQIACVTASGPFSLVLAVSGVTVQLLGITS